MSASLTNLTDTMASSPEQTDSVVYINTNHGYYMMFSAIILFQSLNMIVARFNPPKSVQKDPWRWRNLFISWFHGLICGTWDILCLVLYPELLDDLITSDNYFTYLMIPFSTGYFLYDSIDMYLNNKLMSNWEVTLHHIAVTSMFWYNFHAGICIGYNVLALMAEINSFFLHSRKLLQMMEIGFDHWLYKIVTYLNLLTFLSCRGFSVTRIFYGMFTEFNRVPALYLFFLSLSMIVMAAINCVLFWRLFKSDILKPSASKRTIAKVNGNYNISSSESLKSE